MPKKSPIIYLAVTGILAAGICESHNLTVDHTMAAPKWQLQSRVTDLSLAASDD